MLKYPSQYLPLFLLLCLNACATQPQQTAPAKPVDVNEVAVQTVAEKLNIQVEELSVADSRAMEFSDASLDCPQPGMMYAQVITPGHRVLVKYQNKTYDVRVSGSYGQICDKPAKNLKPAEPRTR